MPSFARFGNDLHSGRRSIDFIGRRRLWYAIAGGAVLVSLLSLGFRGLNEGIQFRGGSEFRISKVADPNTRVAQDALAGVLPSSQSPLVSIVGGSDVRVQTDRLSLTQVDQVKGALAKAYKVSDNDITTDF